MREERRKLIRSDIFFIVNFRHLRDKNQYTLGITDDVSQNGVRLESSNFDHSPGDNLELVLRDPHSSNSLSTEGEIIWKKDGWYECAMGIRLKDEDFSRHSRILTLIAGTQDSTVERTMPYDKPGQARDQKHLAMTVLSGDMQNPSKAKSSNILPKLAGTKLPEPASKNNAPRRNPARLEVVQGLNTMPQVKTSERQWSLYFMLIAILSILSVTAYIYILNRDTPKETVKAGMVPVIIKDVPAIPPEEVINPAKITLSEKIITLEQVAPVVDLKRVIHFDFLSDEVSAVDLAKIDEVEKELNKRPGSIIKIEGHADNMGPAIYNLDISMRRAMAVKKLLIEKGIESRKIHLALFGDSQPVASNTTASGRARNRRVELLVTALSN